MVTSQTIDINLDEIDKVSREDIDINLEVLNKASKVVIDINVDVLDKTPTNSPQGLREYVEEEDFKFEEYSEAGADTAATEAKEIPVTEVIQVKEDDDTGEVEMKFETEPNNETRREKYMNRSWLEEAINQSEREDDRSSVATEVFEISLVNMNTEAGWDTGNDSDETVIWSPRVETLNLAEPAAASVSNKFHSLDEMSQDSKDENPLPFKLKEAYVAMKSAIRVIRKERRKNSRKTTGTLTQETQNGHQSR